MSRRVPFVAGNWKMHKTTAATRTMLAALLPRLPAAGGVEVGVAPPFTALSAAAEALAGSGVRLGAQNLYPAVEGAYTGEVSPVMLADVGADFVILGHSERRALLGEDDDLVGRKVAACISHGLTAMLCCGETREQRDAGRTEQVLERQLRAALASAEPAWPQRLVVAYEPIWAIGTGLTATPAMAQEAHAFLRGLLGGILGAAASGIRILYGGSVKPDNAAELMAQPDVDGALVGGASLEAAPFAAIVAAAAK